MPQTKFPFTPILGWSASRYDTFTICRRRYFFRYYAKYDPELPLRQIDALRGLGTVPLTIGTTVHTVIEELLNRLRRSRRDIDRDRFRDYARRRTEEAVGGTSFQEVHYGERAAVTADDLFPKVAACLDNLLDSDRYRWLVEEAAQTSADWLIDPPGYGETRLEGLKAYFKVDFLFPVGEHLHILDWKTGQPDDVKHRKQLVGYAAWAVYHYGVAPDRVRPAVAYLLPQYSEVRQAFGEQDLKDFAVQIRAETRAMHGLCRDVDQNIPLDKAEFTPIDDDRVCRHCEFRGLCYPDRYPLP